MTGEGTNEFEERLREAVVAVRAAFAHVPPGEPALDWPEHDARAICGPIDRIGRFTLENYFRRAMTTWGGVNDFKRTLPLAIEILSNEPVTIRSEIEPYLLASKLEYAKWRSWPDRERRAIEAWLDAIWPALLSRPPIDWYSSLQIGRWIAELVRLIGDVAPRLKQWAAMCEDPIAGEPAAWHLAACVGSYRTSNEKHGVLRYPTPESETEAAYFVWLISRETERRLATAFFRATDERAAEDISAAQNWLEVHLERRGVS